MRRTHVGRERGRGEGRESRRGERRQREREKTLYTPPSATHTFTQTNACVEKRKGVVDRLAGRLVPLSMHADGLALYWNASRVLFFFPFFLSFFFRGVEAWWNSIGGTERENGRVSSAWERERERGERGGSIAIPDATLRFETGEKQAGWVCVGIFHPLRTRDALSSFPIVTYTQVACTVLTLFETGPFVYRYVAPSAEYRPKGSHGKRVEGCRRRGGRTPSLILHVAFLLSLFFPPLFFLLLFLFFSSPLLRRSRIEPWSSLDREFFIKLTRPVDSFGRQISDRWSYPLLPLLPG